MYYSCECVADFWIAFHNDSCHFSVEFQESWTVLSSQGPVLWKVLRLHFVETVEAQRAIIQCIVCWPSIEGIPLFCDFETMASRKINEYQNINKKYNQASWIDDVVLALTCLSLVLCGNTDSFLGSSTLFFCSCCRKLVRPLSVFTWVQWELTYFCCWVN